jgi:hypothetical protein
VVEEAVMADVTREQVLEQVAGLGPLSNVSLITTGNNADGLPIVWYPEIGFRYLIIEKDDLARAVHRYLWEAGVRRFKSEAELLEAQRGEKWEGWDTCADYRRMQQAMEGLAKRGKK